MNRIVQSIEHDEIACEHKRHARLGSVTQKDVLRSTTITLDRKGEGIKILDDRPM
jgi:hypothetical protein